MVEKNLKKLKTKKRSDMNGLPMHKFSTYNISDINI